MALCEQFPNTSSGYGQVTIITYDGSREIGRDVKRFNLSVPDNVKPTLTGFTLTDTNTVAASVVPGGQALSKSCLISKSTLDKRQALMALPLQAITQKLSVRTSSQQRKAALLES